MPACIALIAHDSKYKVIWYHNRARSQKLPGCIQIIRMVA
jgi:hypothetical protein